MSSADEHRPETLNHPHIVPIYGVEDQLIRTKEAHVLNADDIGLRVSANKLLRLDGDLAYTVPPAVERALAAPLQLVR